MQLPKGHIIQTLVLDEEVKLLIQQERWDDLDAMAKRWLSKGGIIHQKLLEVVPFEHIEHILALRQGPDDDEGIWHDDGSRLLAFSLSLTNDPSLVDGGEIEIRHKEDDIYTKLLCQNFGTLVIFNTGNDGFEHRVSAVKSGKRLVLAGWCT